MMKTRNHKLSIILIQAMVLFSFSASSAIAAKFNCATGLYEEIFTDPLPEVVIPTQYPAVKLISDNEWNSADKLLVNGTHKHLTFSFDGEIAWDELLKSIKDDKVAMKRLNELMGTTRYKKSELMKILKYSEKQFDQFVIRKGSPLAQKKSWLMTELPPRDFARMVEIEHSNFFVYNEYDNMAPLIDTYAKEFSGFLNKRGYETSGWHDNGFVEIAHSTFDIKPSKFEKTMNNLDKDFPKSMMHMHMGIPTRFVSEKEAIAVTRAIEAKTILSVARQPIGDEMPYTIFSSLRKEHKIAEYKYQRGVVRLGFNEFEGNFFNFELRQYQNTEEGIEIMKFGSTLATNPKALYKVEHFAAKEIDDLFTANLNGALEYVGYLFKNKNSNELNKMGTEMISMAKEIEKSGEITEQMRTRVRTFLEKNKIDEKLKDLSIFMKVD